MMWDAINRATGQFGGLQPSFALNVQPIVGFTGPAGTQNIPSGSSTMITVSMVNNGASTLTQNVDHLHSVDANGNDVNYPYCGNDPAWLNGNAVQMNQASVARGQTATFSVHVCGQAGYTGPATLRLQYVREGVAHYLPLLPLQLQFG